MFPSKPGKTWLILMKLGGNLIINYMASIVARYTVKRRAVNEKGELQSRTTARLLVFAEQNHATTKITHFRMFCVFRSSFKIAIKRKRR